MHKTRYHWTRILVVGALSAVAGFAGYRSTADTVTATSFKGYTHLASRLVETETTWGYAENWVTAAGVTGPGKPQPVAMASAYAELDTATSWDIIHTNGQQSVDPSAIQASNNNLSTPGGAEFTLPGVHWTVDLTTFEIVETSVNVHSTAVLNPSGNTSQGVFSETFMDRDAGIFVRTHSNGRRDSTPTGSLSVVADDGAEPVPAGDINYSAWIEHVNNGTMTKVSH